MAEKAKRQIDNYRLLQLLGEGSYGEVYLAEHVIRGTKFAVKLLRAKLSKETLSDFLNEARVFRLDHPNIMHVRDFGIEQETPFLVMDYLPGGTLRKRHPFGTRVDLKTIVNYVKQIGEALQYAHDEGLVHRDVKPENMLLGPKDEVLLSDFGIVTTSYTWNPAYATGVAGTVLYMAPEQIQARPVRASDQYALAAIVYEWLTGVPPFRGLMQEMLMHHLHLAPQPLRERLADLPEAVEEVVLKGLAKDPRQRFASVREFAEALEQASKPPVGSTLQQFALHQGLILALAWSPDGTRIASGSSDGGALVWQAEDGHLIRGYREHTGSVTTLAWSPDGMRLASGSSDGSVQVWDSHTGSTIRVYSNHTDEVLALSWEPQGTRIASAGSDKAIHLWDALTGLRQHVYHGHQDDICSVAWSPDGRYLASSGYDTIVQIREVASGNTILSYHSHFGGVYALAWSPDSKRIASASYDKTVQVREILTGNVVYTFRGHTEGVLALSWSPDGERIASGGEDGHVYIWEYSTGRLLVSYQAHSGGIRSIGWSPDGSQIASSGTDQVVHIWQAS